MQINRLFVLASLALVVSLFAGCGGGAGGPAAGPTLAVDPSPNPGLGEPQQLRLVLESLAGAPVVGTQATVDLTWVNGLGGPILTQSYAVATLPWSVQVARSGAVRLGVTVVNHRTNVMTTMTLGREIWGLEYVMRDLR